ncbi:MAG TPA: phosphatidate cytidylyltransferase [Nitrolancea sp.]|nr:phosphatidate cytidylyltransferase [Nitrolancea sp.]
MLRQRSISAVGIVLFAAIPAFIGGIVFAAAMLVITLISIHELLTAYRTTGYRPFRKSALVAGALFVLVGVFEPPASSLPWLITGFLLVSLLIPMARKTIDGALIDWALTFSAVMYVAVPLMFAIALRKSDGDSSQHWSNVVAGWFGSPGRGLALVGIVFAVTWLNDTAAYLAGRKFGKTKLIPSISPGKTRVGAIAGVFAGTLAGALAAWIFGAPFNVFVAGGLGCLLAIAGQLGDLAESLIKRNLGIKDMGNLIPGHGGMLDRIDALLFTFPVTFMLAALLTRIGWM